MTKASLATWLELLSHSGFVILSTFVIRISSLSRASSRRLLQICERLSFRFAPTAEEPGFHRRGRDSMADAAQKVVKAVGK